MDKDEMFNLGSRTAKNGLKNEKEIADKFNSWKTDKDAIKWLKTMKYDIEEIKEVKAIILNGYKTDIILKIHMKSSNIVNTENIQAKLISNKKGFNQIDKRCLKKYKELWNIKEDVYTVLKYFTGELSPYKLDTKDKRRMFLNELSEWEVLIVLDWFEKNKIMVVSDILKGRGEFSIQWILVVQKIDNKSSWILKNIDEFIHYYSQGPVCMSPRGSIKLGKIGIQRKGGDRGRETAKMLQFKIDPSELFQTYEETT